MPNRSVQRPVDVLDAAVVQPLVRLNEVIQDTAGLGRAFAVGAGVLAFIRGDIFLLTVSVYMLASGLDWFLGRRVAHCNKTFSKERADMGLLLKSALVMQIGLIWIIGREVAAYFGGGWGGAVAAVFMAFATLDELDSVETNRIALGGRPIPGWSKGIRMLRGATDRLNLLRADMDKPDDPPGADR